MTERTVKIQLPDSTLTAVTVYENDAANQVAVFFPAMGVAAAYYQPFIMNLAANKIIAVSADLRGLGLSGVRPARGMDFGFHEMLEADYKGIMDKMHALYPSCKKYMIGHSLGGILASLFLARHPESADGLVLIASGNIHYKNWDGWKKYQVLFATQFFRLLASAVGYFPGDKIGFGGVGAKTVMHDWSYTARTGRYKVSRSAFDYEPAFKKITVPVLAISFSRDDLTPPRATKHLCGKMSSAAIEYACLDMHPASGRHYSHYNWVKQNDEVVNLIKNWMYKHNKK
ncbi:MAG: hypothetical protein KatS3mg031_0081 [Chitinophagales bacterium]|nr:MAG: hypothetical protein KatS3mg031_0081 [Chitinophagales bacterium]